MVVLVGSMVAAGSALAVVYGPYPYVRDLEWMPIDLSAFYNAMSRPVFVTALAWVVIVCTAGYGGNLTLKRNRPRPKLKYCNFH